MAATRKKYPLLKVYTSVWRKGFRAKIGREPVTTDRLAPMREAALAAGYTAIRIIYK